MIVVVRQRRGKAAAKPAKPRKDYPLFAHGSGQWAKKVRGQMHYFGVWSDPVAAELAWEQQKEAILEGRDPNDSVLGDSVSWLCDAFLESKHLAKESGELTTRAFNDYYRVCRHITEFFGRGRKLSSITAIDLERYRSSLKSTWGPVTTNNHLRLARVLFKYGNDIDVLDGATNSVPDRTSRGLCSQGP